MNFPTQLSILRDYKNWSVHQVSKKLGIRKKKYRNYERGKSIMEEKLIEKISKIYRVPYKILMMPIPSKENAVTINFSHCTFSGNGTNGYVNNYNT